jgi:hypothetical protein
MSSDFILALILVIGVLFFVNIQQQRARIVLLARALHPYQIERLMQSLIGDYLRAMGETQAERRTQVLGTLQDSEHRLRAQLQRLAADFGQTPAARARVSRIAFGLPWATQVLPGLTFDLRRALAIHADGVARAMDNARSLTERDRAYAITAELMLLQHSCHWFCKSRNIASARLLARHHTSWAQTVEGVTPETRTAYLALITGQTTGTR